MKERIAGTGEREAKIGTAGIVLVGSLIQLNAAVYVAPSDIGNYGKKASQNAYDYYFNKDSMVAGGLSDAARKVIQQSSLISDDIQPIVEGHTLDRPKTTILTGSALRSGGSFSFRLPYEKVSDVYRISSDAKTGKVTLAGKNARNNSVIIYDGDDAVDKGGISCLNSGKSGCYVFGQPRTNLYYNIYSGEFRADRVMYRANGIGCGKYGSGCRPPATSNFTQGTLVSRAVIFASLDELQRGINGKSNVFYKTETQMKKIMINPESGNANGVMDLAASPKQEAPAGGGNGKYQG